MSGHSSPRVTSPVRVSARHFHHHLPHSSHHHHPSITAQVSSTLHRRARSRDERVSSSMVVQQQVPPRASLEVPRSEGVTPGNLSPNQSRRGSFSLTPGAAVPASTAATTTATTVVPLVNREEVLRREKEKAEARTTGLKRSIVDLTTATTKTSRRLDDAYRVLYGTFPYLQQAILNLKELAVASKIMNEGFIDESRGVVSEVQSQLDAFGSFDEQQARVQALQDRVHNGQEKIASLSARVDVVRQRVEQWERADREWQERTRRRLKYVWGFVLAVGLVLMVLYIGARTAYAPQIEGVARELQEEAVLVKMKLEGSLGNPDTGGSRAGAGDGDGDGATPALNFSRHGKAEAADEAFRALDEL